MGFSSNILLSTFILLKSFKKLLELLLKDRTLYHKPCIGGIAVNKTAKVPHSCFCSVGSMENASGMC